MLRRLPQILSGVLLGLAFVAAVVLLTPPPSEGGGEWDGASPPPQPYPAPPLELLDVEGETVNVASFRGRTTVVFFGYTHCPDVCPATLLNLSGALDRLTPRQADRLRVVFVSLDPERDTPERLRSWMANFHPSIVALTADRETVWSQASLWGVHAAINPRMETPAEDPHAAHQHDPGPDGLPEGLEAIVTPGLPGAYAVEHSTRSFVLDRQGRIVLFLAPFQGAESMAMDLRRIL
jgi:protein SCO1